jgi:hypothetical protein
MNKKIKEAILDIMEDNPNIGKEEVIELIKTYDDSISIEKLIEKEYKAKATRLMSSFKDERGIRDIFSIRDDEDLSTYINIARSKELEDLNKVKKRLEGNIRGNRVSLWKVEERINLVSGQQTLYEIASAGE